jgi:replicative DNA helicase Mcm
MTVQIREISRSCCYDNKTEILTNDGWKAFTDVLESDEIITLNSKNQHIEIQKPVKIINEHYQGKMYSLQSSKIDLCVTPNHRMYIYPFDTQRARKQGANGRKNPDLWEIKPSCEIFGKRIAYKRSGKWNNPPMRVFEVPGLRRKHGKGNITLKSSSLNANDFLEFLGYYISEGNLKHTNGTGYSVVLNQGEGMILDKMVGVIERLGFKPNLLKNKDKIFGVRFFSNQMYNLLKDLGTAETKFIPKDILKFISVDQALILLNALIDGDGSRWGGAWRYYTISKQLADDVQHLALKAGLAANISISDRTGQGHTWNGMYIKHNYPSYVVKIQSRQIDPLVNSHGKKHDKWVDYNGTIHCVTVPNGILYVRRNGKAVWCGNTHQLVRQRIGVTFTQESQRYFDPLEDPDWFVIPPRIEKSEQLKQKYIEARKREADEYRDYRENKIPKEDARFCLPNACKTTVTWTFNMSSLIWFLEQRLKKDAQWEIRMLATKLYDLVMTTDWKEFMQHWKPESRR